MLKRKVRYRLKHNYFLIRAVCPTGEYKFIVHNKTHKIINQWIAHNYFICSAGAIHAARKLFCSSERRTTANIKKKKNHSNNLKQREKKPHSKQLFCLFSFCVRIFWRLFFSKWTMSFYFSREHDLFFILNRVFKVL